MKKSGKIVLLVLLAVIIAVTLIACDNSTQQGGNTGGNTGGTGGGTVSTTVPYGLSFDVKSGNSAFAKAIIGEFDVTKDVTAYVLMQTDGGQPYRTGEGFPVTPDMIADGDVAKLSTAGSHYINVEYEYEGVLLKGTFMVHLQNPATKKTTVTFDLGDGKMTNSGATFDSESGLWSVPIGVGTQFTWEQFIAAYKIIPEPQNALAYYTYGDGEVFGAEDTLVVTEGLSLTAVYTSTYVTVNFDLNAPADIIWKGESAPTAPASESVALSGKVPRPLSQNYESVNYRLLGWSLTADGGDLWNFNSRFSAQSDASSSVTLYAVWSIRQAFVTFDLGGGTFVSSLPQDFTSDISGLSLANAVVTYDEEGKVEDFGVDGIVYGTSLADYYVTFALNEGGNEVSVALVDIDALITKGSVYECRGLYFDKTDDSTVAISKDKTVDSDTTVYVVWQLAADSTADEEYFEATFDFVLKPDNTYSVTADDLNAEILYIPAAYNGLPVTEIAAGAFRGMSTVISLDFSGATNLVKIGANAFSGCSALASVTGYEELHALTTVGKDAFYGTTWLNAVAERNEDVTMGGVLVRYAGGLDESGKADLSGKDYKYIAAYAFSDYNVNSVVLPAGIVGIDNNAFAGSELNGGVTVAQPAEGESVAIQYIGATAFAGSNFINNASDNIIIGNVFYRAINAAEITVPAGVTVIAEQAFAGCSRLANLKFESEASIVSVGRRAFRGTAYANNDEDGFVIINGILAGYYGKDATVVVPDEVTRVGAGAFDGGVVNVVFRSTSKLAAIDNYAFADASSLASVSIYVDNAGYLATLEIAPYAFANAAGSALASSALTLYAPVASQEGASETGALAYLASGAKIKAANVEAATRAEDVFLRDYVAKLDEHGGYTDYTFADLAEVWNVPENFKEYDEFETLIAVTVPNGILVTRNGITIAEDYRITSSECGLGDLKAVSGRPQEKTGTISMSYSGRVFSFTYTLHAAIDVSSMVLDETYLRNEEGKLLFFTSSHSFDESGSMTFDYIIGADETYQGSAPLSGERIAVAGYSTTVGAYTDALKVTYDYYGTEYTASFDFVVRTPRPVELRQTSSATLPLGVASTAYNDDILVEVVYDDGNIRTFDLDSFTVTSVDGALASSLATDTLGLHVAEIYFKEGNVTVSGSVVYAVAIVPIDELYTFAFNADGTATITAASGNKEVYVLPSVATDSEGKEYTVTTIGDGAFSGNTSLVQVYIPSSITKIGANAFAGCTSLKDLLGFDDDSSSATSQIGYDKVKIVSEHRNGSVSLAITGLNDYALSESTVTFPAAVAYDGVMDVSDLSPDVRAKYFDDAEITATYTLTFTMSADVASAIAAKLNGYGGTVRIPERDGAPVYKELYDALTAAGVKVELYAWETSGINVLVGYIEMQDPSTAQVDFTSKTGSVYITSAISHDGNIVYIPKTVDDGNGGVYNVTGILAGMLGSTEEVEAIYIPDTVVYFENGLEAVFGSAVDVVYMYSDAASLTKPHEKLPYAEEYFPEKIVSIGDGAFKGCTSFNIDFSTAIYLESIGNNAFEGCTSLDKLVFGSGAVLSYVGSNAFNGAGLMSADLGNTRLSDLGNGFVFKGCKSLTTLKLPSTITQIGAGAFEDCSYLYSVTIGEGAQITYIGDYAFHNCAFDPSVFDAYKAEDCYVGIDAFANCYAH